jgi:hypothetical protein
VDTLFSDNNHINLSRGKNGPSQEEQLEEFHCRWYKQSIIIQKVIELEGDLGHPPDLFDLYSSHRFTNAEIDWLNEEGILYWLLDGSIFSIYKRQPVGDGSNSELCNIIRLCPQFQPQNQFNFYKGVVTA